jgi:hypothetical protein
MSVKKQVEKEIREAYLFLRAKNNTIPSETLQFILDASLEKLKKSERDKEIHKLLDFAYDNCKEEDLAYLNEIRDSIF